MVAARAVPPNNALVQVSAGVSQTDMMAVQRLIPTLVVVACLMTACQFSENRYLSRRVAASELAGKWVATPFAMKSLADVGFKSHLTATDHVLTIRPDGTCSAQTFFHPYDASAGLHQQWLTPATPCRWVLGLDPPHQTLDLSFAVEPGTESGLSFYFDEEDGRLILWQYAADPDAWRYMEFIKSTEAG